MKKSLLLSIAASAVIFAGGDIAPVEPAAPASADFWGQIGFAYQAQDYDWDNQDWGDKDNNGFSAAVVLGVEKEIGNGFGFGAEVAGWTDFGFDIAEKSRVESGNYLTGNPPSDSEQTSAEISQAYLTYTFGNTAIKAGRQALPKAVSPWAWSDRTVGVIDYSYDGIVIANTDLANTTIIAGWIGQIYHNNDEQEHLSDNAGLFMLGLVNKSLSNTTISAMGYYLPESKYDLNRAVDADAKDTWSLWANFVTNNDGFFYGLQGAYVDGDYNGADATFAIAGKIGSRWGNFNAEVAASYINNGDYSLQMAGTTLEDSALWTFNEDAANIAWHPDGKSQGEAGILVKAGYKLPVGTVYGSLGYWDYDNVKDTYIENTFGARAGYKFNVAGVDAKVEYRYRDQEYKNNKDKTRQRLRVEAYYKF